MRWFLSTPLYAWRIARCNYPVLMTGFTAKIGLSHFLKRQTEAEARSQTLIDYDGSQPLKSCLCNQAQLDSPVFTHWAQRVGGGKLHHRKDWELAYIAQALAERGLLVAGKKGLAFAVGAEALPALFAGLGCNITATDLDANSAEAKGWIETNQHAANLESLKRPHLCKNEEFQERVIFQPVDMNHIPPDLRHEQFDFLWSTCSLEHLGSIRKGQEFVLNAMDCLKPGGVAIHTTEFNCSSNRVTLNHNSSVFFRRRDIEHLAGSLRQAGHNIDIDFRWGDLPLDKIVDLPPYRQSPHLKLLANGFVCTSIGLIITKASMTEQSHSVVAQEVSPSL